MGMRRFGSLMIMIAAVMLAVITAEGEGAWKPKPKLEDTYAPLVQSADAGDLARKLLQVAATEDGAAHVEALGKLLAVNSAKAAAVLDELAKEPAGEARLLQAELVFHISRGDEADKNAQKNKVAKPQVMPTEEVGRRAGALLGDADPFVRALAEWAIATRLGAQIEGVRKQSWPDPARCEWFAKWEKLSGDEMITCDFVRQLVTTGEHRTSKGLLKNAEALARQAQGMAGRIRPVASADQLAALNSALKRVSQAQEALNGLAKANQADLAGQRVKWLQLRRTVREVALLNPELGTGPLLFATRTGPEVGNITNGAIRDAYGPGSDLYIKTGLSPADPIKPLLNSRLGPGHMRGMDLWYGADRVVFSWVKQPSWNQSQDSLGGNTEHGGASETAHLWELNLKNGDLKQLTSAKYNSDVEPCYLPGGDIVFASDRSNYGKQQPARWVKVEWPDPWEAAPAGEWIWKNETTVALRGQ